MDSRIILDNINKRIESNPFDIVLYNDAFSCIRNMGAEAGDIIQVEETHKLRSKIRKAMMAAKEQGIQNFNLFGLNKKCLLYTAPECFDDFMLYMEINRPMDKQFYFPRRKQLKPIADAMERLAKKELELLAVSLPPGTGKTTISEFFVDWNAGRNTQKPILIGSHNKDFLSGVYGECLRHLDPQGEYLWHDVFPDKHIINTNAKTLMIDVGKDKTDAQRFMTIEFTSIGAGNAGKVRAEQLLYCDDLVDGLETALSKDRLDKLWGMYTTDLRQRKIGDCVELHIATRWSVHDVISRLERLYDGNSKAEFITIPALDENDRSNFDYPIEAGFTTKFYIEQRAIMDDASWKALYMNKPIEREGQLYPEEQLRRYFELPDGEPDAIISVCDTKDKGTDYCVMPIAYQYGNDYYIEDVLCDNSNPDVVEPRLVSKCLQHKIQMSRFESNSAGGKIAEKIQQMVKENGGRTKITTKYTTQNKETKIIMASPYVLEHFLFKDNSAIKDNKEYKRFLNFLCSYTMAGKNKNDDVPDAMAMLADYIQSFSFSKAEIIKRPW